MVGSEQTDKVRIHDFIDPGTLRQSCMASTTLRDNRDGSMSGWIAAPPVSQWEHSALVAIHGFAAYPHADRLLICADSGGSNGYRIRLMEVRTQAFADDLNIESAFAICRRAQANGIRSSIASFRILA
jgi:hypothetical protein